MHISGSVRDPEHSMVSLSIGHIQSQYYIQHAFVWTTMKIK